MSIRKIVLMILMCMCAGVAVVLTIDRFLAQEKDYSGGFKRLFRNEIVKSKKVRDLNYNSYYLAGVAENKIFLGNIVVPSHILTVKSSLKDTTVVKLRFAEGSKLTEAALNVTVSPPNIFAIELMTPAFLRGTFDNLNMNYQSLPPGQVFGMPTAISTSSFICKSYNNTEDKSILTKVSLIPGECIVGKGILERQTEGLFSMAGLILYDRATASLVYVYYYRNEFIRLDTSLNVLYKSHTIDTITKVHLRVATISSQKTRTLSAPPVYVNRKGYIFNNRIFIWSAVRSDVEEQNNFNSSLVIDTYSLATGRYEFSFRLPHASAHNLSGFAVTDSAFIAVQDRYLFSYKVCWPD